jgi:hypothetical protein
VYQIFYAFFVPVDFYRFSSYFVPSQQTMLTIAASEATGVVIQSKEAKQAFDLFIERMKK